MIQPAIYDSEKRYIFSNWSNEDFIGTWGGVDTLIKKGESIELPQYKAFHFTRHLVDREMMKANIMVLDSQEARDPFEAKTCAEITAGIDSPAMAILKEKIKSEIANENVEMKSADLGVNTEIKNTGEFADITEEKEEIKEEKEEIKIEAKLFKPKAPKKK